MTPTTNGHNLIGNNHIPDHDGVTNTIMHRMRQDRAEESKTKQDLFQRLTLSRSSDNGDGSGRSGSHGSHDGHDGHDGVGRIVLPTPTPTPNPAHGQTCANKLCKHPAFTGRGKVLRMECTKQCQMWYHYPMCWRGAGNAASLDSIDGVRCHCGGDSGSAKIMSVEIRTHDGRYIYQRDHVETAAVLPPTPPPPPPPASSAEPQQPMMLVGVLSITRPCVPLVSPVTAVSSGSPEALISSSVTTNGGGGGGGGGVLTMHIAEFNAIIKPKEQIPVLVPESKDPIPEAVPEPKRESQSTLSQPHHPESSEPFQTRYPTIRIPAKIMRSISPTRYVLVTFVPRLAPMEVVGQHFNNTPTNDILSCIAPDGRWAALIRFNSIEDAVTTYIRCQKTILPTTVEGVSWDRKPKPLVLFYAADPLSILPLW